MSRELVRANKHIEKLNGRLRGAQGKAKRLQRNGGRCLTVTETGAFTDGEREFAKLGDALH